MCIAISSDDHLQTMQNPSVGCMLIVAIGLLLGPCLLNEEKYPGFKAWYGFACRGARKLDGLSDWSPKIAFRGTPNSWTKSYRNQKNRGILGCFSRSPVAGRWSIIARVRLEGNKYDQRGTIRHQCKTTLQSTSMCFLKKHLTGLQESIPKKIKSTQKLGEIPRCEAPVYDS